MVSIPDFFASHDYFNSIRNEFDVQELEAQAPAILFLYHSTFSRVQVNVFFCSIVLQRCKAFKMVSGKSSLEETSNCKGNIFKKPF